SLTPKAEYSLVSKMTKLKLIIVVWIMVQVFSCLVECYSSGAPTGTCLTRYPKHKTTAQTDPPPYDISLSPAQYKPGDTVTVTVLGKSGAEFKGIQMAAFRSIGNGEEVLGNFIDFPEDKIKAFTCLGSLKGNMITQKNDLPISNLTVKWLAPDQNVGDIIFKSTIVQTYDKFWVDIINRVSASNNSNIVDSSFKITKATQLTVDVTFSECGNSKGCFLYPSTCSGNDCTAAVTFQHDPDTDRFNFEIMSNNEQDYVSLGFSHDNLMGEDEIVMCVGVNGHLNIQHGWNPSYHSERQLTMFVYDAEIREFEGRLQCRFTLPKVGLIYIIDQEAEYLDYYNKTFDHSDEWYLQIAWGRVIPGSDIISKHTEIPPVTYQKINLKATEIFRGSTYGFLVQAHAALMIVSWMFITGIVTVISRHYREWMPRTRWFGTKVWFQVHRALSIFVAFLTVLAVIFVFSNFGIEIRKSSIPHSYVGLTVLTLVIIQVIFGLLRPGPDDKLRIYFNWGHQILGQTIHLLAAVTMFLGFNMKQANKSLKSFGLTVLTVWIVGQIVWHIIFEIIKCKGNRQDSSTINGDVEKDKKDKNSNLLTVILILYVIFLLTLSLAALSAVMIY
ncbi:hypothetical protein Btru_016424, partial [Bulinus truncatus]